MNHIIVFGSPLTGLRFMGPFNSQDEAIEKAMTEFKSQHGWHHAELEAPSA